MNADHIQCRSYLNCILEEILIIPTGFVWQLRQSFNLIHIIFIMDKAAHSYLLDSL